MIITTNLKEKCARLKKIGFTHVSSVCSSTFRTTYRHYVSIDQILKEKTGKNLSYGRYNGQTSKKFHSNNKYKAISYQDVFNFF